LTADISKSVTEPEPEIEVVIDETEEFLKGIKDE
tara:strand:+ start:182 stop:283 length:102 start_codon:yes stop_codon:yes gene_type:complete